MEYFRYGSAQLKLQLVLTQLQVLFLHRNEVLVSLARDISPLYDCFSRKQWQEETLQFLEECLLRYSINLAICKVSRQTRGVTDSEMSRSVMNIASKEYWSWSQRLAQK